MKVYIINSITKSYILNIKIRPLVTEYALMIKLVDGTSSAHSFNPYAYFGHLWSYFDIQNLRLVILYIFVISTKALKWITVFLYLLVLRPTISSLQNIELNCCKITIKKHNISISKWCKSYTNVNEINIWASLWLYFHEHLHS